MTKGKEKGSGDMASIAGSPGTPTKIEDCKFDGGAVVIKASSESQARLSKAFAGVPDHSLTVLLPQVMEMLPAPTDGDYTYHVNAACELLEGLAPETPMEAMLAVQMVASHMLGMNCSRRALHGERVDFRAVHANIATKAQRTFVAQVEGLTKLRRNGEQVVKHVHINEGAQAVIAGTINQHRGEG